ncbi:hypothetical protein XENOCAPTIV_030727 [Xenoophorus captivus]|uniref:Uncharacterized protein n=1 Tax=Xenoophorus captivus TaxID=1517983 RepID=A0ABV0RMP4_9TELE
MPGSDEGLRGSLGSSKLVTWLVTTDRSLLVHVYFGSVYLRTLEKWFVVFLLERSQGVLGVSQVCLPIRSGRLMAVETGSTPSHADRKFGSGLTGGSACCCKGCGGVVA